MQDADVLAEMVALRIAVDRLADRGVPLMSLLQFVQGVYDARHAPAVLAAAAVLMSHVELKR